MPFPAPAETWQFRGNLATVSQVIGLLVALVGSWYLAGWMTGRMAERGASALTMKTNAALSLLLLGIGLVLARENAPEKAIWARRGCAVLALLIGGLTFLENVADWNLGIDQLLATEPAGALGVAYPNRMGTPGSLSVALSGLALLLQERHPAKAQLLAIVVLLTGLLGTIGYLYGVQPLYSLTRLTAIALPTALAALALGAGLLLARPARGMMALATAADPGGEVLRRLLLPAVALPLLLGYLQLAGQRLGHYDPAMGSSLMALASILIFSWLVYDSGKRLARAAGVQRRNEEALREAGQNLRKLEEQRRAALDSARMGTWDVDISIQVVRWDERCAALFQMEGSNDVPLAEPVSRIHPDDRGQALQDILAAMAGEDGGRYDVEYRVQWSDGQVRWVRATGQTLFEMEGSEARPVRFVGVVMDTTERKRAEEALRQSESFHRQTLESIPGMVFTTRPDGYCDYQSQQWVDYTGVPYAEQLGDGWNRLLHPDDRERALSAWHAAVEGRAPYDLEYRVRRRDGEYEWFKVVGRPIRDAAGDVVRWFGVATNVQSLKRTEEALRQRAEEVERAGRERNELLEREREAREQAEAAGRAKDEFLATLSHELRTPLNAMLGWAVLIRTNPDNRSALERGIEAIERSARTQSQLINDLLDMARIISGRLRLDVREVDVPAVAQAAVDTVRPAAEAKEIDLDVSIEASEAPMAGDPDRLQQVLWNLLSNAVKFTPRGGRVQLRLERGKSQVVVTVRDTGKGIAPELLPHVFERFRQGPGRRGEERAGLGLGLAIVRNLVELHGGTVEAASAGEGHGCTFTVRLPVRAMRSRETGDQRAANESADASHAGVNLNGLELLVVDDHAEARELLRILLEGAGGRVRTAASGEEAVAAMERRRPGMLICDIDLPGIDGYEVVRRLRAVALPGAAPIPAVALTAHARPEDRVRALQAGFHMYVAKPADPAELLAVVATLASRIRPVARPQ